MIRLFKQTYVAAQNMRFSTMAVIKEACTTTILVFSLLIASYDAKSDYSTFNGEAGFIEAKGKAYYDIDSIREVFNVLQFGADSSGFRDSARGFVNAFNAACRWKGNAQLLIPAGEYTAGPVSFKGPCKNTSPLVVRVLGVIKADSDISLYESREWIEFDAIDGLIVSGNGRFDGQGNAAWQYNNCTQDPHCDRLPSNLMFHQVRNAIIHGISSDNSKGFHLFITHSDHIHLRHLNIVAPADSPNTDGIHISRSSAVAVSHTIINTGDDCVSITQGSNNITIKEVICGSGHGYSIGSLGKYEDEKDVKTILFQNSTLSNTDNGLRIKTWAGAPKSQASGIIFQDIIMENVQNPIIIDQNYGSSNNKPSGVKIKNIQFNDIRGTTSSNVAVNIVCSPKVPCQNVRLSNIKLKYVGNGKKGKELPLSSICVNANVIYIGSQNPPPCHNRWIS